MLDQLERARPTEVRLHPLVAYRLVVRWQAARIGTWLPVVVVVQAALAVGVVVGFGFLIPEIDTATATFLATGAPTVLLLTVGLAIVPQQVGSARQDGTWTYLRSLPVPRSILLLADLTVWLAVVLPGLAIAVLAAWWRYDIDFSFDWPVLVAAGLLSVVTATAVGYAMAVTLPPLLATVASQVLVFFVLLFSPLTYPAEQLPAWFQRVHQVLPVQSAGDAIRSGLVADTFPLDAADLLTLLIWCLVGVAVSLAALRRRT